jgi:hypothetical protein
MALKTPNELLEVFDKATKKRKETIANNAGFSTADEYREHIASKVVLPSENGLDMVIAFDTTGSMSSYISDVKRKVSEMTSSLFKNSPNLRIGVVAFGDYCDMQSVVGGKFGKAYQVLPPTNDEVAIQNFIRNAQNTSGGDGDEFYELVIKKVVRETQWREGVKKSLFLIGDADPHGDSYRYDGVNHTVNWEDEVRNAASNQIQIDTLNITGRTFYKKVSELTDGVCMHYKKSQNISTIVEGLTYARTNVDAFTTSMRSAEASGDSELIGAYKSMTKLL